MDAKGVATKADYQAMLAGLGKAIAAVPSSKVMDVYNAYGSIVSKQVPNYLMSTVSASDAADAYKGFLEFKDAVKRWFPSLRLEAQELGSIKSLGTAQVCVPFLSI